MAEPSAAHPGPSTQPRLERHQGVIVIGGSLEPTDGAALCLCARPLLADLASTDAGPIVCEVASLRADAAALDVLARLALIARHLNRGVRLRDAPPVLRELLALAGLADVVPCEVGSGLDPGR